MHTCTTEIVFGDQVQSCDEKKGKKVSVHCAIEPCSRPPAALRCVLDWKLDEDHELPRRSPAMRARSEARRLDFMEGANAAPWRSRRRIHRLHAGDVLATGVRYMQFTQAVRPQPLSSAACSISHATFRLSSRGTPASDRCSSLPRAVTQMRPSASATSSRRCVTQMALMGTSPPEGRPTRPRTARRTYRAGRKRVRAVVHVRKSVSRNPPARRSGAGGTSTSARPRANAPSIDPRRRGTSSVRPGGAAPSARQARPRSQRAASGPR